MATGANTQSSGSQTISYSLTTETRTDESGRSIVLTYNGLGQLSSVEEAAGLGTDYSYDALGNLVLVVQKAQYPNGLRTQKRVFEYDHHSRLVKAWMPETSPLRPEDPSNMAEPTNKATVYEYYAGGNLKKKTDARGVQTSYQYDTLDRLRFQTYSDGTPTIEHQYTVGGRLKSSAATGVSSTAMLYDSFGRIIHSAQTTNAVQYNFGTAVGDTVSVAGYTWNLADAMTQMKYPSGRIVNFTMNTANQAKLIGGSVSYAPSVTYAPDGQMSGINYGSGLVETRAFNARGQVSAVSVVSGATTLWGITNEYTPPLSNANNGNLLAQTIQPLNVRQAFSYDVRNRLEAANEAAGANWFQQFGYDDFGNRWVAAQSSNIPTSGLLINGPAWYENEVSGVGKVNNRIKGELYDTAGNQLSLGGVTGSYDAEGRLSSVTGVNGTTYYQYDGFGRRVRSIKGSDAVTYVYDALGKLAAEYKGGFTGSLQTQYITPDQLGTTRLVTNASGGIVRRADYLPFGQEISATIGPRGISGYGASGPRQEFTGKERDAETGLDYFGARYMSAAQGRFTSPDSTAFSKMSIPQSWNLYAYSFNNPLRFVDPTGNEVQAANCGNEAECQRTLAAVQGSLANQTAASRVGLEKIQRGFWGRIGAAIAGSPQYRFTISGDIGSFKALGQNASRFGQLVENKTVVTAGVSDKYTSFGGAQRTTPGGFAALPSQGLDPAATVANNPTPFDTDASPGANVNETMAHELLGHLWGEIVANHPAGSFYNMRDSVQAENAVRATDPSRGQKLQHHGNPNPVVVYSPQEIQRMNKK
ncbi:MAG TPA: RHS repeat-associated core domain-containing protein [Bryobacteraceae bacterium]|nr:RHS repeat-associated core domain-containing protein [Bryobacteraceae bacterium]